MERKTVPKFPCSFPIKVMGLNTADFSSAVSSILGRHIDPAQISYTQRLSSGNKYLSITATFAVQSKEQLDAVYRELNDHELVLMTL